MATKAYENPPLIICKCSFCVFDIQICYDANHSHNKLFIIYSTKSDCATLKTFFYEIVLYRSTYIFKTKKHEFGTRLFPELTIFVIFYAFWPVVYSWSATLSGVVSSVIVN